MLLAQAAAFMIEHDDLLIVAASTLLCSFSHAALRPVLPVFAKASIYPVTYIISVEIALC